MSNQAYKNNKVMVKYIFILFFAVFGITTTMKADSYDTLWKQVDAAAQKDQPRTQMTLLEKIIRKADAERKYGHLLKAELLWADRLLMVAPDSLQACLQRIIAKEQAAVGKNPPLAAVYQAVLSKIHAQNPQLGERRVQLAADYRKKALSNPALLTGTKAADYMPFVEKGEDSKIFDHDLFSIIGLELEDYATLREYYVKSGNRRAACLCALYDLNQHRPQVIRDIEQSDYVKRLDGLLAQYGDLDVAGAVAVERYKAMKGAENIVVKQQIDYIDQALSKWSSWQGMNELRNERRRLTAPMLSSELTNMLVLPLRPTTVRFTEVRNLKQVNLQLTRLNVEGSTTLSPNSPADYKKILGLRVKNSQKTYSKGFPAHADYDIFADSLVIEPLPVGVYLLEMTSENSSVQPLRTLFHVSNLRVVSEALPGSRTRFVALNATSGQPVANAFLQLMPRQHARQRNQVGLMNVNTDEKGEFMYQSQHNNGAHSVFVYTEDDKACPDMGVWSNFSYYRNEKSVDYVNLYTDRSLYRPGQTVHVSALAFKNIAGHETHALATQPLALSLRNANGKVVKEVKLLTDDYGTASADFELPASELTGMYTIRSNFGSGGYVSFNVEEYKRPTFRIEFDEVTDAYKPGDEVEVVGRAKSFAGVPVQGAKVTYTIIRQPALWWRRYNLPAEQRKTIAAGELTTDGHGAFAIKVPLKMDEFEGNEAQRRQGRFYQFRIEATVVDVAGESHSGESILPLGTKPTALSCDLPKQVLKDSLRIIQFTFKNNAGKDVAAKVRYYIDNPANALLAATNQKVDVKKMVSKLPSGRHRLVAVCEQDTIDQEFIVFSWQDKRPCVPTHDWFYCSANEFPRDGKPVYVQYGASDDIYVLYTMISGEKVLESGAFTLNNEVQTRKLTYRNEYGDGILLNYLWMKEGNVYSHQVSIAKPLPEKQMDLKWTTFRDRLVPGQREEWTLHIAKAGRPVAKSQLMAVLYDQSLDQIRQHDWHFSPNLGRSLAHTSWCFLSGLRWSQFETSPYQNLSVKPLSLNRFYAGFESLYHSGGLFDTFNEVKFGGGPRRLLKTSAMAVEEMAFSRAMPMAAKSASGDEAVEAAADMDMKEDKKQGGAPAVQMRENLEETAFFYPALMSDAKGNVNIKFNLPESLTTWRFMGLAHDQMMNYGFLEAEIVAQKDVMVQPNMPRFVRSGDQVKISARIVNMSGNRQTGVARMVLADPESDEVVEQCSQEVTLPAGETISAVFDFQARDTHPLLVCRITVEGATFSDGEQHYLPVLPDHELVTNTLAFTQNRPGTLNIDLDKLFAVETPENRLTIEYYNNPAWLMLQALPTMAEVCEENAMSLASAFYANTLATHVLRQSPKIKDVVLQWKAEQGRETSLMSSLQKNQELKALLLAETPWVMAAEREEDQKQQLVHLFDEAALQHRLTTTLAKLQQLQRADGAWSWWKGMEGSPYMTQAVSEMLVRLNVMTSMQPTSRQMLDKSLEFLGTTLVREYEQMRKDEKRGIKKLRPSELVVRILYTLALDGRDLPQNVQTAQRYMLELLSKKTTEMTIYGKATAAVILAKNGYRTKAAEYLQSIREYTVYKEELGRYFDTPRAYYSWFDYRIPTVVAAIEAIKAIEPNDVKTIEELQRWLLHEKRTTCWDTPVNSVNAVYAFVDAQTPAFAEQPHAKLSLNGEQLPLPAATAGLGYVKTTMNGGSWRTLTVEKSSAGTSWGAVYAQFMQKTGDIDENVSGITVKREILGGGAPLQVGHKVKVRITIQADRDYDFVQVVDKRAACLEPVEQLSGYRNGCYVAPRDGTTAYYFNMLRKGKHVIETEYFIDRAGEYTSGTCTVQCAYAPEFSARSKAMRLRIEK